MREKFIRVVGVSSWKAYTQNDVFFFFFSCRLVSILFVLSPASRLCVHPRRWLLVVVACVTDPQESALRSLYPWWYTEILISSKNFSLFYLPVTISCFLPTCEVRTYVRIHVVPRGLLRTPPPPRQHTAVAQNQLTYTTPSVFVFFSSRDLGGFGSTTAAWWRLLFLGGIVVLGFPSWGHRAVGAK